MANFIVNKLTVDSLTTPADLAEFVKKLEDNDQIRGKPAEKGRVILYARKSCPEPVSKQEKRNDRDAARVAVEVILQSMNGVAGAEEPLYTVGTHMNKARYDSKARDLKGPLDTLANIYEKNSVQAAGRVVQNVRVARPGAGTEESWRPTSEQMSAFEKLLGTLISFSKPKP